MKNNSEKKDQTIGNGCISRITAAVVFVFTICVVTAFLAAVPVGTGTVNIYIAEAGEAAIMTGAAVFLVLFIKREFDTFRKEIVKTLSEKDELSEELKDELAESRSDLDDMTETVEKHKGSYKRRTEQFANEASELMGRISDARVAFRKFSDLLDKVEPELRKLSAERDLIYNQKYALEGELTKLHKAAEKANASVMSMRQEQKVSMGAGSSLTDLTDAVYNDMISLQQKVSKAALYSENTSMEAARNGASAYSVISALEEIKRVSEEMSEETDAIVLSVIRLRNECKLTEKLAEGDDEPARKAVECSEEFMECLKSFAEIARGFAVTAEEIDASVMESAGSGELVKLKAKLMDSLMECDAKAKSLEKHIVEAAEN